jgi:hypothetical protein
LEETGVYVRIILNLDFIGRDWEGMRWVHVQGGNQWWVLVKTLM